MYRGFLVSMSCFLVAIALASTVSAQNQAAAPKKESELIAILRSDKPEGEKALACKHLSVYGTNEAVPELAKLLSNERLASWARIALEAIPGATVDESLRKAAESLQGRLLVGVINSIGVRRDAGAVGLLSGRLEDKDAEVASAAAVALGRVGNAAAAERLAGMLAGAPAAVRSAIAEGCVLCAERFLADGKSPEAVKLYDQVRKADVLRPRMLEATRGAILARGEQGIPLLVEQLRSTDKGLFQIALGTAREFPGRQVDKALASELDSAAPERVALILLAMADRKETVELAAILKAAGRGPTAVRIAASEALGRVGNATCVAQLLTNAMEADAELAQTAKDSLVALPGAAVDQEIVARLEKAEGKAYPLLVELVGERRIDAVPALLKALNHSDRAVRNAALTAMGHTAPAKYLSVLITQVVAPTSASDAEVPQNSLKTAAVRMPDREACATELAAALDRAPLSAKTVLLEILGAVGGTKALAAVSAAAKGTDATLQDVGSRLLGEWRTIDAAPALLSLAKGGGKFQTRALRGYIGIAQKFTMSEQERVEMCANALEAAKQPAEQKLVLDVLKRYPNLEMFKLAIKAMQIPGLKEDAGAAAVAISQKVAKTDEVKALLTKAGLEK